MVDDDTRTLALVVAPIPDVPDLQFSTVPTNDVIWIEPRRYGPTGPIWDSTDEIYITYKEGERALVTTGPDDIFNKEHSYQRTGSARYDKLSELAGDVGRAVGGLGRRAGAAAGRIRRDPAPSQGVPADRGRHRAGQGSGRRAHRNPYGGGESAHGSGSDARDLPARRGIPERPDPIRSHRHCPGCSGHAEAFNGGWELAIRAGGAWVLGYLAIFLAGVGIDFAQYMVLTSLLPIAVLIFRPVWREYVIDQSRRIRRSRR